jgi:hypothetical protein
VRRALLIAGLLVPDTSAAQGIGAGLRGGAGWDTTGDGVWAGQLEIVEFGRWSSVEVGLSAFEGGLVEDYTRTVERRSHDYHEETHLRGLALTASLLIGHAPEDSRGPYALVGLGIGPIDVGWRAESPTDPSLDSPRTGGGSFSIENGILPAPVANAGVGMRVHRHVDVRAQGVLFIAPSTDTREDMKAVAALTFTTGLTF